jgi:ABC-2 type transport system ATP-binding protein
MIEINGLSKTFGEVVALSDVSFKVAKGQIVGFLGANGAGKTTTMDILCGCLGADKGNVKINGFDITESPEKSKMSLGYLPDDPPLYGDMRVEEYITFAAKLHKIAPSTIKEKVDAVIQKLSIDSVRNRIIANLSKGYRQRVGLAQALVHEPEVLILDEPTEGLDPNQIAQIRGLVKSLAGKHTILLSSHILSEVQNTCDYIVIIHKGKIIQQGSYDELVKMAEGGAHSYKLVVVKDVEKLAKELESVGGVNSVRVDNAAQNRLEFSIVGSEEGALDVVVRKVLDGGFGFKELVASSKSLEDIFFQLTR